MTFIWKDSYNKYMHLQRNCKTFSVSMLKKLVSTQQRDIAIINSHLKKPPFQILDIGCGMGIYDLAINDFYKKNFGSSNIKFYLLDKTTTAEEEKKVHYGYREKGSFYNNLDYTKEFLTLNGINENCINCISVDNDLGVTNDYLQNNLSNIDLVISIISWGFHYPIKIYLDTVYHILSDDGLLCLHCRNLAENLPLLKTKFDIVRPTTAFLKYMKMYAFAIFWNEFFFEKSYCFAIGASLKYMKMHTFSYILREPIISKMDPLSY